MSLADLIKVNISVSSANPTRPSFGRVLIMAANLPATFQGLTQIYGSLEELTAAGFPVTHPAYLAASILLSQKPSVSDFKIGRRSTATVQTLSIYVASAPIAGAIYRVKVGSTEASYTALISDTPTTIAAALAALIDTDPVVIATSTANVVLLTRSSAGLTDVANWSSNLSIGNTSADPGIAADLAAVKAADNDWFGVVLDSNSKNEVLSAAAWCEANRKMFSTDTSDGVIWDGASTTDLASQLKAFAYANTHLIFCGKKLLSYAGAGMFGAVFTDGPGSVTWKFKTMRGVPADDRFSLTTGQSAAIRAKHGNVYSEISGIPLTEEGKTSSGEYADVTHFVFWQESTIQLRVFVLFARSKKIPFTDAGIAQVVTEVRGGLQEGFDAGGLADAPGPEDVKAPKALATSPLDRAARRLRPVTFTMRLAGAIHSLEVTGTLTV